MFKCRGGSQANKIPRDRRILLRKKKKLNLKLHQNNLSNGWKEQLQNTIKEIDKKNSQTHSQKKKQ